jgi:soluble lytic murein transglycosylase
MTFPLRATPPVLALALVLAGCSSSRDPSPQETPQAAVEDSAPRAEVPAPLPGPEARARGVAALRRGGEIARAGDAAGAARAYAEAAEALPVFRGWAEVLSAAAAAQAGDTTAVRRHLSALPPGPAREWGWEVRVRALGERRDPLAAVRVAEAAGRELREGARAAEAWRTAGEIRARSGDVPGALAAFRRAVGAAPASAGALGAARAALELPGLTPEDRLLIGRTLLEHGGTERGVAGLEAYLASGAGTAEERDRVRLEAGRALFRARRYAGAEPHLRAAAERSAEAALLLGRALYRRGRETEGAEALARAGRRFPREEAGAEALLILGDLERDAGRPSVAREHYRAAVRTGTHGEAAAQAAVRLAALALLAGNPAAASAGLEAYLAARPRDARTAPALYWAGRAAAAAGDTAAARRRFQEALQADPVSFHAARAAERLREPLRLTALPAPLEAGPGARAEVEAAFFRMDLLRELGLEEEAAFELARMRERLAGDTAALYLVAEGMIPRGQPVAAAILGQEIRRMRGTWDRRLLRIAYQFPYRELVEREARRHGLDPYLVAGLIRQESWFNPRAVSRAGAVGLMQVMPETGRGLARRVGMQGFEPGMLHRPETNVRLGTLFLADQLRRYRTRTEAFAAYNAGPGRVARWRAFPEYRDEDLFIERIPFEETREYVKRVRLNTHIYRMLYAED